MPMYGCTDLSTTQFSGGKRYFEHIFYQHGAEEFGPFGKQLEAGGEGEVERQCHPSRDALMALWDRRVYVGCSLCGDVRG